MNVYLYTSTASHNDEQHPTTRPIVGEAYTDAEGRQPNVDIPCTTTRTDQSFFYPNEKSSTTSLKWDTGNGSESTPLPCLGDERIVASKDVALAKISVDPAISGGSQKENKNIQFRDIRGSILQDEPDESSPSKKKSSVFFRHGRIIAQQMHVDVAERAMSAPTAVKIITENVETSSTTNENIVSDVSLTNRIART